MPVTEDKCLGLARIELEEFFLISSENSEGKSMILQRKYRIFPEKSLAFPEFFIPDSDEQEKIKKYYKGFKFFITKEHPKQEIEVKEQAIPVKGDKKKETKAKDTKKQDKKGTKKGGKEEPEKKTVPMLDWLIKIN